MPFPDTDHPPVLPRHTKVLLVMDVVESVRLMEQDEDGFVQRWRHIVGQTQQRLLPLHGGRIVKSLGDGLMLEFANELSAMKAAFALQEFSRQTQQSLASDACIHLRIGGHLAEFVADSNDIYGSDVNLTARIATLCGPGEIVISAALRDQLTAGIDADIEDLGLCHLKHVKEPVHAFRVGPVGHAPVIPSRHLTTVKDHRPTIAIIPFEARSNDPDHAVIGELIADGVIAQLSRSRDIRVISRLSTTAFRGRSGPMSDIESFLGATYALSGSYFATGGKLLILAELADTRKNDVIWAGRLSGEVGDLLQSQSEMLNDLATTAARELVNTEVAQSLVQPMPRLDSSSLLLGGIALMHRSSMHDFERSRQVLEALQERHNRSATPLAWLSKWHTMRVIRGMSESPKKDTELALEQTRRALDLSPDNALALAIEGYARCQLLGDAQTAGACLERAIQINPNEPMAWLYQSVWSTMWGGAPQSVDEAQHAVELSPIDPLRYFFDVILAASYLTDRNYDKAIELANRSLKNNKDHLPALRVLLGAQGESGRLKEARATLEDIVRIVPTFNIQSYLAMGSSNSPLRQRLVAVLRTIQA